jgi:hypothetical protein
MLGVTFANGTNSFVGIGNCSSALYRQVNPFLKKIWIGQVKSEKELWVTEPNEGQL